MIVIDRYHHRLAPRQPVYLFAPHGDGVRFARLWGETWRRLPLGVRRALLRHWRSPEAIRYGVLQPPLIELLEDWGVREDGDLGAVSRGGHQIRFAADVVDAMPDDIVRDLIAHELAHVYQWAIGEDMTPDPEFGFLDIEECADEMVRDWGFGVESIDDWSRSVGRKRVVHYDSLTDEEKADLEVRRWRAGRW